MAASTTTRPGTQAKVRYVRMSASKARVVLNLIRGKQVTEAAEILQFSERLAAQVIAKALNSAIANAEHNEDLSEDELFVSACYADEGPTLKRFRPRARGRAGRIHKQTCHIVVEVSRMTEEELDVLRTRTELKDASRSSKSRSKSDSGDRAKRVAKSKAAAEPTDEVEEDQVEEDQVEEDQVEEAAAETDTGEATETGDETEATAEAADESEAEATDETAAEAEAIDSDAESANEGATDDEVIDGDADDDAGVK